MAVGAAARCFGHARAQAQLATRGLARSHSHANRARPGEALGVARSHSSSLVV